MLRSRSHEEVETSLISASRMRCTASGNPRFMLHTVAGQYSTAPNASINFDVERLCSQAEKAVGHKLAVTLCLDSQGRCFDIVVKMPTSGFCSIGADGRLSFSFNNGVTF